MSTDTATFAADMGKINLADGRLGAAALACSDDSFAEMSHLVLHAEPTFTPHNFDPRGQIYSGWETARSFKRTPDHTHDWCVVKLGATGIIHMVDIDTSFFKGNYPTYATLEGASAPGVTNPSEIRKWTQIVERSPLRGHCHNYFAVKNGSAFTHVRLNIFPDGGVARLRVFGDIVPDSSAFKKGAEIDLAAVLNGGQCVAANDNFYSPSTNLIMPGRAENPAGGWETTRRRGPGNHWVIIKLGRRGTPKRIVIDTNHFKFNAPESCSVEGVDMPDGQPVDLLTMENLSWRTVLNRSKVEPHSENHFEGREVSGSAPVTHIRFNAFPCGAVSRLRVFGEPAL